MTAMVEALAVTTVAVTTTDAALVEELEPRYAAAARTAQAAQDRLERAIANMREAQLRLLEAQTRCEIEAAQAAAARAWLEKVQRDQSLPHP